MSEDSKNHPRKTTENPLTKYLKTTRKQDVSGHVLPSELRHLGQMDAKEILKEAGVEFFGRLENSKLFLVCASSAGMEYTKNGSPDVDASGR